MQRDLVMQRWTVAQHELMPELKREIGSLMPKLEKLIHVLEWNWIETLVDGGLERH